jgi:diaminohydroxyphosphoribosylaminopyrimidine deaminase/5-amino-6-(5-phosphoribosylamino)uracil reductase
VIVRDDSEEIVGAGFHPRAGWPHAEIFALLQAAGHLDDGVAAARSVIEGSRNEVLLEKVTELRNEYLTESGASNLFGGACADSSSTAYVTLEPCCHYGQTPPCAASLAIAKVSKVVVGFRDPNPRVDGGGFKVLQEAGIDVVRAEGRSEEECAEVVKNFVKRITPRSETDYSTINGAKRRALRALAGRKKTDHSLCEVNWSGKFVGDASETGSLEEAVSQLYLEPSWMEATDGLLWENELILLRLNNAVAKKKGAKLLGDRIAEQLNAHVAQVVGHTALLYRPSIPPKLDLEETSRGDNVED